MKYEKDDRIIFTMPGMIIEVDGTDMPYLVEDVDGETHWCSEDEVLGKVSDAGELKSVNLPSPSDEEKPVTPSEYQTDAYHQLKVIEVIMASEGLNNRIKLEVITYCTAAWAKEFSNG